MGWALYSGAWKNISLNTRGQRTGLLKPKLRTSKISLNRQLWISKHGKFLPSFPNIASNVSPLHGALKSVTSQRELSWSGEITHAILAGKTASANAAMLAHPCTYFKIISSDIWRLRRGCWCRPRVVKTSWLAACSILQSKVAQDRTEIQRFRPCVTWSTFSNSTVPIYARRLPIIHLYWPLTFGTADGKNRRIVVSSTSSTISEFTTDISGNNTIVVDSLSFTVTINAFCLSCIEYT